MLHLFVLSCQNYNLYCLINITKISKDHRVKRSDTKILIDDNGVM